MWGDFQKAETTQARADWVVVGAVRKNRSARARSLQTAKFSGNFSKIGVESLISVQIVSGYQAVAEEFPKQPNREFIRSCREIFWGLQGKYLDFRRLKRRIEWLRSRL
jgi:hypothetical protein